MPGLLLRAHQLLSSSHPHAPRAPLTNEWENVKCGNQKTVDELLNAYAELNLTPHQKDLSQQHNYICAIIKCIYDQPHTEIGGGNKGILTQFIYIAKILVPDLEGAQKANESKGFISTLLRLSDFTCDSAFISGASDKTRDVITYLGRVGDIIKKSQGQLNTRQIMHQFKILISKIANLLGIQCHHKFV